MITPIKINKKEIDSIIIFYFSWQLDWSNVEQTFESILKEIADTDKKKIIFNFKDLEYLNSKSIWYIADIFLSLEKENGIMNITNCSKEVKDILDIVGLSTIIPIIDTEDIAIKNLI